MANIVWNEMLLRHETYSVNTYGGHQLRLQRLNRDANGPVVFMLPGFLEDSRLFFPENEQGGLAPFLAAAGYDVFIADLRGKGESFPSLNRHSRWGLHYTITEDIPAHLRKVAKLRPEAPQYWLGQGMGSVLLTCCYARQTSLPSPVIGMVHFSASRLHQLSRWGKSLRYIGWKGVAALSSQLVGSVRSWAGRGGRETQNSLMDWQVWHHAEEWLDPVDAFDYRAVLQKKAIPPALYFTTGQKGLWGGIEDCRRWVQELGFHNARIMTVGKKCGNLRDYSTRELLLHPQAAEDHFQMLPLWLKELSSCAADERPEQKNSAQGSVVQEGSVLESSVQTNPVQESLDLVG